MDPRRIAELPRLKMNSVSDLRSLWLLCLCDTPCEKLGAFIFYKGREGTKGDDDSVRL